MGNSRRDRRYGNKRVVHITNRTVVGLPFLHCVLLNNLTWSALAKAQSKAPAQIAAVQFMGNHFHMILFGRAKLVSRFMNVFKGEIGKYLKRLYGDTFQSKVWAGRFKEQLLATPDDVMGKLEYLYLNPTRAGLVDSVDGWCGVSTWKMFLSGSTSRLCRWIPSRILRRIFAMPTTTQYADMIKGASEMLEFNIDPLGWLGCFSECKNSINEVGGKWSRDEVRHRIIDRVRTGELDYRKERWKNRKKLKKRASWISPEYKPKRVGRTPFIICHDKVLRLALIQSYKEFCHLASVAYHRIKAGEDPRDVQFPPGALKPPLGVWAGA